MNKRKPYERLEDTFRQLWDATFEALAIHDHGTLLEVNQAFCQMYGYDRSEVIGKSAFEFIAPDSRDLVRQKIATGDIRPYEGYALRKDGTPFAVELIAKPITYQGRRVRIAAIRDVSEHKRAEDALRDSQARLAAIIESAMDAIIVIDADQKILQFNTCARQKLRPCLSGRSFIFMLHVGNRDVIR